MRSVSFLIDAVFWRLFCCLSDFLPGKCRSDEAKGSIFSKIGGMAGAIRKKISGVPKEETESRRQEEDEALTATTEGEEAVLAARMEDPYRAKHEDVGVVRSGGDSI